MEEKLGKEPSDLILTILDKREEILLEKLATKEDLGLLREEFSKLREEFSKRETRIAWRITTLLILQAGVIVALIKLI